MVMSFSCLAEPWAYSTAQHFPRHSGVARAGGGYTYTFIKSVDALPREVSPGFEW